MSLKDSSQNTGFKFYFLDIIRFQIPSQVLVYRLYITPPTPIRVT